MANVSFTHADIDYCAKLTAAMEVRDGKTGAVNRNRRNPAERQFSTVQR
jgi:hypothetical protein